MYVKLQLPEDNNPGLWHVIIIYVLSKPLWFDISNLPLSVFSD